MKDQSTRVVNLYKQNPGKKKGKKTGLINLDKKKLRRGPRWVI